jgi:hypothetical protein
MDGPQQIYGAAGRCNPEQTGFAHPFPSLKSGSAQKQQKNEGKTERNFFQSADSHDSSPFAPRNVQVFSGNGKDDCTSNISSLVTFYYEPNRFSAFLSSDS